MLTLSAPELRELTGRRRSDAQARALEFMGIPFSVRPDGTPVVLRAVAHRALGDDARMVAVAEPEPELEP